MKILSSSVCSIKNLCWKNKIWEIGNYYFHRASFKKKTLNRKNKKKWVPQTKLLFLWLEGRGWSDHEGVHQEEARKLQLVVLMLQPAVYVSALPPRLDALLPSQLRFWFPLEYESSNFSLVVSSHQLITRSRFPKFPFSGFPMFTRNLFPIFILELIKWLENLDSKRIFKKVIKTFN